MYTYTDIQILCSSEDFDTDFNQVMQLVWQVIPVTKDPIEAAKPLYPKQVVHKAIRYALTGKTQIHH